MNKYNPGFQENRNAKKDTLIVRLLAIAFLIGGFQVATQYFAHQFNYQDQLGAHFNQLYAPRSILVWSNQWYDKHSGIFDLTASYGILFSSVGLVLVLIIKMMLANSSRANRNLYGSARWADKKDIEAAGLLWLRAYKKIWSICSQLQQTKISTGGKIPTQSGRLIHRCVVSCALFPLGQTSTVMGGQF